MTFREPGYCRQVGTGPMRQFTVTFTKDPPERAGAVQYFSGTAMLRQASPLPHEIDAMSDNDAQAYLDSHPVQKSWSILNTATRQIPDEDFSKLRHLPELERVYLYGVGNAALAHLLGLHRLIDLVVYSDLVNDECLKYVAQLSTLQSIDFQASTNVTTYEFEKVVKMLPNLTDWYPPR